VPSVSSGSISREDAAHVLDARAAQPLDGVGGDHRAERRRE